MISDYVLNFLTEPHAPSVLLLLVADLSETYAEIKKGIRAFESETDDGISVTICAQGWIPEIHRTPECAFYRDDRIIFVRKEIDHFASALQREWGDDIRTTSFIVAPTQDPSVPG